MMAMQGRLGKTPQRAGEAAGVEDLLSAKNNTSHGDPYFY